MSLAEVYRALWRHRFLLVAGTAVVVAAAWYGIGRLPPTYQASALVRVDETAKNAGEAVSALQAGETLAQTYATVVSSGALNQRIHRLVVSEPDIKPPVSVHVSASVVQGLDLFWVHASSPRARIAAAVANATPIALGQSVQRPGTKGFGTVTVVKQAAVPLSPSAPHKAIDLALAFVVGLAFNAALILLGTLVGDRLPPLSELERTFGVPVLGTVPRLSLTSLPGDPEEAVSPVVEAGVADG